MADIILNDSLKQQIAVQISPDILRSGNLRADVYFKNNKDESKKVKLNVIIWNGDTIKDEDIPDVYKNWIPYIIKNIEILESINNNEKGNIIMEQEKKREAVKFQLPIPLKTIEEQKLFWIYWRNNIQPKGPYWKMAFENR